MSLTCLLLQVFASPLTVLLSGRNRGTCCGMRPPSCCPIRSQQWSVSYGNLSRYLAQPLTRVCLCVCVWQLRDCVEDAEVPMDGVTMTLALHRRGVNVRYLGAVLRELERNENKERLTYIQVVGFLL